MRSVRSGATASTVREASARASRPGVSLAVQPPGERLRNSGLQGNRLRARRLRRRVLGTRAPHTIRIDDADRGPAWWNTERRPGVRPGTIRACSAKSEGGRVEEDDLRIADALLDRLYAVALEPERFAELEVAPAFVTRDEPPDSPRKQARFESTAPAALSGRMGPRRERGEVVAEPDRLVWAAGFEPATPGTQSPCSTRLSYAQTRAQHSAEGAPIGSSDPGRGRDASPTVDRCSIPRDSSYPEALYRSERCDPCPTASP